ncbi:MAG: sulfite exporter TauE/SafE family protein [Candidatus Moranbacteria bacterium]|nr:sulfite exporter TauE/SafE family protein [Candidatus Moranbacteria bacterium]
MSIGAIIIGLLTGFISAFFGIGGSSIDTPLLRVFLHVPDYIALGSPLPTALLTIAIALTVYWKKHLVNYHILKWSLAGGIPGIIFGAYLSGKFSGLFLMLFSALVLFFVGVNFVYKRFRSAEINQNYQAQKPISASYIIFVAFIASSISGILANGGGLLLIPAYVLLFKLKIKEAIATSLLTVAAMFIPAFFIHYSLGHIDLGISVAMAIGVIPMAYIGAKTNLETKSNTIQLLFGLMLIIFSIYFFISQLWG